MKWIFLFVLLSPTFATAQSPAFEFSASACTSSIDYSTPAVVNHEYRDGHLTAVVEIPINCAHAAHKPTYKILQDVVEFDFETFSPYGTTARCVCKHVVKFKLALEPKQYVVRVTMNGNPIRP